MPTYTHLKINPFITVESENVKENSISYVLNIKRFPEMELWQEELRTYIKVIEKRQRILYRVASFVHPVERTTEMLYFWIKESRRIMTQVVLEEDPTDAAFGWDTKFKVPILKNDQDVCMLHFQEKVKFSLE